MNFISHRRNTIGELKATPTEYGVEVDIRSDNGKLVIHHDPFASGDDFEEWIKHYQHGTLILNVKEEGLEARLIDLMKQHEITDYFFLDQSFPFLIKWSKLGERHCAVRVSEFESIETALTLEGKIDWVWVDCFTKFPLSGEDAKRLQEECMQDWWGDLPADLKKHYDVLLKEFGAFETDKFLMGNYSLFKQRGAWTFFLASCKAQGISPADALAQCLPNLSSPNPLEEFWQRPGTKEDLQVMLDCFSNGTPGQKKSAPFVQRVIALHAAGGSVMEIADQHGAIVTLEDASPSKAMPGARFTVRFSNTQA